MSNAIDFVGHTKIDKKILSCLPAEVVFARYPGVDLYTPSTALQAQGFGHISVGCDHCVLLIAIKKERDVGFGLHENVAVGGRCLRAGIGLDPNLSRF